MGMQYFMPESGCTGDKDAVCAQAPVLMKNNKIASNLYIETEMHDVAILYYIILAFYT